jgi:hypothetical protein
MMLGKKKKENKLNNKLNLYKKISINGKMKEL